MRFIYNPFSRSFSKLQVSNESLQWLLKGLLASPLTALFLQVSVTDHRMVESQQALKNGCVQERIMVMERERQNIEVVSTDLQAEPTTPASHTGCHPTIGAFPLWQHLDLEHDKNLFLLPSATSQSVSSSGCGKPAQNHLAGSALSLVTISQFYTSALPYLAMQKVW